MTIFRTHNEVMAYLRKMPGASELINEDIWREKEIDGKKLLAMDHEELKEMGVYKMPWRVHILAYIKNSNYYNEDNDIFYRKHKVK